MGTTGQIQLIFAERSAVQCTVYSQGSWIFPELNSRLRVSILYEYITNLAELSSPLPTNKKRNFTGMSRYAGLKVFTLKFSVGSDIHNLY